MTDFEFATLIYKILFKNDEDCKNMNAQAVLDAIENLDIELKQAIELHHRHGMNFAQVGKEIGRSQNTARTYTMKARMIVRSSLYLQMRAARNF